MLNGKRILLIVGGGIAAYKALELVRRLGERGASVRVVLTEGGAQFVTPLSFAVLSGEEAFTDLFDLKGEAEIGHIQLSREADLVVVAPATADLLAKMANGLANDLASTVLMATDKTVLVAPAMNVRMWEHPATVRNVETLMVCGLPALKKAIWRAVILALGACPSPKTSRTRSSVPCRAPVPRRWPAAMC